MEEKKKKCIRVCFNFEECEVKALAYLLNAEVSEQQFDELAEKPIELNDDKKTMR